MVNSTTTMITSIAMIILFSMAILGFSIGFANDNDADVRVDQDPNISSLDVIQKSGMDTFAEGTEDSFASIINTTLEPGSDAIKSPGVFTITWSNLFKTFSSILTLGYRTIFGNGKTFGIFLTAFLTLLGFLFTLYIIKAWRGNP